MRRTVIAQAPAFGVDMSLTFCRNPPESQPRFSGGSMRRKTPQELRSYRWYGVQDLRSFGHRSRTKQMGFASEDYAGKPVIGIVNTWSDMNPCHAHFRTRADEVKRGVWQAGGFPVEMPAMSLGEPFMKPSTMLYRNLLALETEELLRANPIDGVVLLGGCDKTVPAMLMGAASMNIPAIFVPAGPMLRGNWRGNTLGSGSDVWKYWAEKRAGNLDDAAWGEIEDGIARSFGTCMTMGTASTMAAAAEALGMTLPGASSIPAADSGHPRLATASGRRIVEMVWEDLKPTDIMSTPAFENAVTVAMSLGGSTNAIVHLIAMAGRAGAGLDLDRFDALSRRTPLLANIRPSGKYLMEDFYYAGGLRGLMGRLSDLLNRDCMTVNGRTLDANIEGAQVFNDDVIATREKPVYSEGGVAVLRGNLAPDGAVIKHSAAERHLLRHAGPAMVFRDYNDMAARIDDPNLPVTKDSVLVLQNAGPLGGPGMPEWGQLPIPKKLLQQGVRDMVRVSDARMSGTSYGACVLHVAPESFIGGPLGLIQTGDVIALDVPGRRIDVRLDAAELERRRKAWTPPKPIYPRGYGSMHIQHVTQANKGCDLDFMQGRAAIPEPEIH
jgi:dihydroxy-acid dehydratase